MYSIYADDTCVYNDMSISQDCKVINPNLTMAKNSAGSLTMTVPKGNSGYEKIQRMSTEIIVQREGKEIWSGRVIDEKRDFWNRRSLTCEGELAYLNDSIRVPDKVKEVIPWPDSFLFDVLGHHNAKMKAENVAAISQLNKEFSVGEVTVPIPSWGYNLSANYETTMECIKQQMLEREEGYLRIRKENGIRYLDYLVESPGEALQTIEFGKNLLNFTRSWDMTELATVIIPRGERIRTESGEERYVTVEDANNGSVYVEWQEGIEEYGRIEKVVDWSGITDPSILLAKAKEYLRSAQFNGITLEISLVDLHLLNKDIQPIELMDYVHCQSTPHGLDLILPVIEISIPLDRPFNAKYTIGSVEKRALSMYSRKSIYT